VLSTAGAGVVVADVVADVVIGVTEVEDLSRKR